MMLLRAPAEDRVNSGLTADLLPISIFKIAFYKRRDQFEKPRPFETQILRTLPGSLIEAKRIAILIPEKRPFFEPIACFGKKIALS